MATDNDVVNGRTLTSRQREVLELLTKGKSNKEIARILGIAEATTKIHLAALLRTLNVRNRTQAAFVAGGIRAGATDKTTNGDGVMGDSK